MFLKLQHCEAHMIKILGESRTNIIVKKFRGTDGRKNTKPKMLRLCLAHRKRHRQKSNPK